ncbi:MAG: hypothetical protein J6Q82_05800 [Clostridia bacterium]|nr:hypothetical protein [Clostridia bacterium]
MNQLKVGYAVSNIDPMIGIEVCGYYQVRISEGNLDPLEACVTALEFGEKRIAMVALDLCLLSTRVNDKIRVAVSEATGLAMDEIYIGCTHTHTAPDTRDNDKYPLEKEYVQFLTHRIIDTVKVALADLKPAKMGYHVGEAKNIAFVRRFRMKDGSVKTNPGVDNPDIVAPIGDVDERVNVIRFDREGADTVVVVNFGNHPDVVGGNLLSGDWPAFTRRTVEKAIDGTKCIFFNGVQGDVNHVNVHPRGGDLNDMFMDFDDVSRGYGHARHMGRVVAGSVLQVFDKVKYVEVDSLKSIEKTIQIPSNKATPEQLTEAKYINEMHVSGRDAELPWKAMMLTTVVAEAQRMINLENAPDAFPVKLLGLSIGPVAFVGIPGEPFTGIGRAIKDTEGFELICPCCLINGCEGYFPMQDAYDEGGYEARSSRYKAGCAEYIAEQGKELLAQLGK